MTHSKNHIPKQKRAFTHLKAMLPQCRLSVNTNVIKLE